jgi:hypothetical protein
VGAVVKVTRALLALVLLAPAGTARAHPELLPTLVNRYISLIVVEDSLQIVISLLHGDLPGGERRRAMDTDGSGTIEEPELAAERAAWSRQVGDLVGVRLDGRPVSLAAVTSIELGGEPRVTGRPVVVELAASIALAPGPHALIVEPGADRPRDGETEVTLDLGPRWSLVGGGRAREPEVTPGQNRFLFSGPRAVASEDRAVTFVIEPAGGAASGRAASVARAALLVAVVAAAVALAVVALRIRRRAG